MLAIVIVIVIVAVNVNAPLIVAALVNRNEIVDLIDPVIIRNPPMGTALRSSMLHS